MKIFMKYYLIGIEKRTYIGTYYGFIQYEFVKTDQSFDMANLRKAFEVLIEYLHSKLCPRLKTSDFLIQALLQSEFRVSFKMGPYYWDITNKEIILFGLSGKSFLVHVIRNVMMSKVDLDFFSISWIFIDILNTILF